MPSDVNRLAEVPGPGSPGVNNLPAPETRGTKEWPRSGTTRKWEEATP